MNKLNPESGSILPILIMVVLLLTGSYFYLDADNARKLVNQVREVVLQQDGESISQEDKTTIAPTSDAQVMITKDGFTPHTLTVAKGQALTWVNVDRSSHEISSLPKTAINSLPDLDSGILQPTDSFTFIFEKTGTFKYANKANSTKFKGVIIVQ